MRCRGFLFACLFLAAVDAERFTPACGTLVPLGEPVIVYGVTAKYGPFPWHVGVYKVKETGYYNQICGGTLVGSDLVISAAHCFYDETNRKVFSASEFKIAGGKFYRSYDRSEPYVQKTSVKSIDVAQYYIGFAGNYAEDIALVRLETPFNFTALVKPICMDWDNLHEGEQLQNGTYGKVVGWGYTEEAKPSEALREISLPVVSDDNCIAMVTETSETILTEDKFCAGYLNGSSVCSGDSGGGLCFMYRGLWYLRGIVSTIPGRDGKLLCDNHQYAAFTNVGRFRGWIRAAYDGAGVPQSFRPFISLQDKFCAGLLNGSSVCKGDSGGGLCFESEGRWYLRGIVSTIPTGKTADLGCDSTKYAAFTDVGYYRDWIHEAYYGPRTGSMTGCILPDQPVGGSFQPTRCRGRCNAGRNSTVPINSTLVYECNDGYILKGNRSSICGEKGWESLSSCSKQCPPILDVSTASGINTFCKRNDKSFSCGSSATPGTKVSLACQDLYKISGTQNSKYAEMTCLDGGEWDRPALRCVPECGKSLHPEYHWSFRGSRVYTDLFPWHVIIFDQKSFCGGTLISEFLVLTSGDCFSGNNGSLVESNNISVMAGISYSFNRKGIEQIEKVSYIQSVKTDNVALIHLKRPLKMSLLVRPVCIDWEDRFVREQLRKENIGKISIAFNAVRRSVTRSLDLEIAYMSREDCLSVGRPHNLQVPAGMFCGRVSDEGIRLPMVADNGHGLYFESNGVWYLRGILDSGFGIVNLDESVHTYGIFMNIRNHLGWIYAAYDV